MKRDACTAMLVRMLKKIEAGKVPGRIREVYVYGDYARGALEPEDLEMVIVHDMPGPEDFPDLRQRWELQGYGQQEVEELARDHCRRQLYAALRSRSGHLRLILTSLRELVFREPMDEPRVVRHQDVRLVWSEEDRQWRPKFARLRPDPKAGKLARPEFFPAGRFHGRGRGMSEVVLLQNAFALVLFRRPLEKIVPRASPTLRDRLKRWQRLGRISKDLARAMPYAVTWFDREQQLASVVPGTQVLIPRKELWSVSGTHRAEMGRPSLTAMLDYFRQRETILHQCLIPYFTKRGPNELLIFEKAPNWSRRPSLFTG